jgi:hypothetical protein
MSHLCFSHWKAETELSTMSDRSTTGWPDIKPNFVDLLYQVIQEIFYLSRLIAKQRQHANHHIPLCGVES